MSDGGRWLLRWTGTRAHVERTDNNNNSSSTTAEVIVAEMCRHSVSSLSSCVLVEHALFFHRCLRTVCVRGMLPVWKLTVTWMVSPSPISQTPRCFTSDCKIARSSELPDPTSPSHPRRSPRLSLPESLDSLSVGLRSWLRCRCHWVCCSFAAAARLQRQSVKRGAGRQAAANFMCAICKHFSGVWDLAPLK